MEKITLKPVVKELLYKTDEVNTHVDVLAYSGTSAQEKTLGTLALIGHASYDEEEDLGYVISLVASLAKREYYSEQSLKGQNPKAAFENALKKLNEVLEDFFKNKSLSLNLGLAAVVGDQIYISKLGKFKVGLARGGEHIDVLNNIALFHKSTEHEQQFSNVISGKLFPGDKIFAYYPARPITSRDRMLQGILVKESQDQFVEKIDQLATTIDTFACCGVHISLEQIREIPLQSPVHVAPQATLASSGETAGSEPSGPTATLPAEKPRVIAAELSVSKKTSPLRVFSRLPAQSRTRKFVIIAVAILVPLSGVGAWRATRESGDVKAAYERGIQNLELIKQKIAASDAPGARELIAQTLAQIQPYQTEKFIVLHSELQAELDSVNKVSTVQPVLVRELAATPGGMVLAFADDGTPTVVYNGAELLSVNNKSNTLQDPVTAIGATLYEGNLYTLAGGRIYKYADAVNGGTKRSEWGAPADTLTSLAADGDILGLSSEGAIITYFKGAKKTEFEVGFATEGSQIATAKDSPVVYLSSPANKRLYAFDKLSGTLKATYKLDNIGELKTITPSSDGVWLISSDHKVWKLTATQP